MCQLIESIQLFNGKLQNIAYHNERFNRSRRDLFGIDDFLDLSKTITIPADIINGTYKCRLIYSDIIHSIDFQLYIPKTIKTLRLIDSDNIDYSYKYSDRSCFDEIKATVKEDDILIVKNGFITDSSFSNVVFFDGINWITPSTYLLNGTMRHYLLDSKKIFEKAISPDTIKYYLSAKLINAMLPIENSQPIEIIQIY